MDNPPIYAWSQGARDLSKWLEIELFGRDSMVFKLGELCSAGKVSSFSRVEIGRDLVQVALRDGAVQISQPSRYFLLRRRADELLFEFMGEGDAGPTRSVVQVHDVVCRVEELFDN